MKKILKKALLVLLLLCVLTSLLSRCRRSDAPTDVSSPASVPASSVSSSVSSSASETPEASYGPLVDQEVFGLRFQLPERIADTRQDSDDALSTYYYPPDNDPDATRIMFSFNLMEELSPTTAWDDSDFDPFVDGLLSDTGVLLQKGDIVLNPSSPINARYVKFDLPLDDMDRHFETVVFSNILISMAYDASYEHPYNAVWDGLLDSLAFVEAPAESTAASAADGIRPEFKEMMDSYEAFFDEYAAFMQKYQNSSGTDTVALLSDFSNYMEKYTDYMEKLNAVDQDDLSTEEALYYLEVTTRINKKLLSTMS